MTNTYLTDEFVTITNWVIHSNSFVNITNLSDGLIYVVPKKADGIDLMVMALLGLLVTWQLVELLWKWRR